MIFDEILGRMKLVSGPEGHSFQFPGSPYNPESAPDIPVEYLNNAYLLYVNPVLRSELEEKVKILTEGAVEADDMVTKEACKLSIKALLSFYDSLKMLHDKSVEEREKRQERESNPRMGREETMDEIPGFPSEAI
jgi:hypothetical protein